MPRNEGGKRLIPAGLQFELPTALVIYLLQFVVCGLILFGQGRTGPQRRFCYAWGGASLLASAATGIYLMTPVLSVPIVSFAGGTVRHVAWGLLWAGIRFLRGVPVPRLALAVPPLVWIAGLLVAGPSISISYRIGLSAALVGVMCPVIALELFRFRQANPALRGVSVTLVCMVIYALIQLIAFALVVAGPPLLPPDGVQLLASVMIIVYGALAVCVVFTGLAMVFAQMATEDAALLSQAAMREATLHAELADQEARLLRDANARAARLVDERTRDLEAARDHLLRAQRTEALGQLAGGIAHDMNNVLQLIQLEGDALLLSADDPEQTCARANAIVREADRGASITRRLLTYAHRDNGEVVTLEVARLLEGMRQMLRHTLGAGITVDVKVAEAVPPLCADKGELETVLINLATNARDAMSGLGALTLAADTATVAPGTGTPHPAGIQPGTYVRLSVTDTGTGMDAATSARATEPFFTTKPPGVGTGLGLSMALGFAQQCGGGLQVDSALGRGTTITLWLPVAGQTAPRNRSTCRPTCTR
jgi:signal transduction histidine kinase